VGVIIKQLDLLISPDTSLIHVASCFNVKVVGLYKSNVIHIERFYPYLVEHRTCISTTEFVDDIPVEDVKKYVIELYK
jgi:heptosyltransferase-3